ncbi:MAG: transposase [Gammaproteobacteria bacterium]|jgi:REP element-mobilizing transposase RayT|nr:transposase [Pseudomonas sp.]NLO54428.1 transposase [Gammaproteobacteria bacterium]
MSWNDLRVGRYSQAHGEYLVTFNTHNRITFFDDFELAHLFCQHIAFNERLHQCTWLTWVLMPDHFHGLLRLDSADAELSKVVGALKGASAHVINKHLNSKGKLWQSSFHDRALRAEESRIHIARYIVGNPLRKELVTDVKDYPFWNSVYL